MITVTEKSKLVIGVTQSEIREQISSKSRRRRLRRQRLERLCCNHVTAKKCMNRQSLSAAKHEAEYRSFRIPQIPNYRTDEIRLRMRRTVCVSSHSKRVRYGGKNLPHQEILHAADSRPATLCSKKTRYCAVAGFLPTSSNAKLGR